jgi:DNA-binding Lrp family transcriptional regulator
MSNNNASEPNNNADNINQENDYKLIDEIDQKLLELLLKGYTNKRIALEAKSPLSTIQRRIRKIFENQYIHKKTELNHKRLGLRKGYLLISLIGDYSNLIAQKVSLIKGITGVSLVTGSIDMIESVKTIERVDKVSWAEEVHNIASNETTISSFQGSINMNTQDSNTNNSSTSETAL